MKKYTLLYILVSGLALLSACTSSTSHILVGQPRHPTDPAHVIVYATPPKHYEPIAVVTADSKTAFQPSPTAQAKVDLAMERAKQEAAALGANGLLFQAVNDNGGEVNAAVGVGDHSVPARVGVTSGPLHKQVTLLAIFVTEP